MFVQFLLPVAVLLSLVLALPLAPRDVVDPPVTSPTAATVWHVGQTQTVTWNATGLPVNQSNPVGMLVLGYLYNNSENLMLDSPLATNLNYSVGQAQITVPNVPTRTDYIVVLFGDSGNASPEFTIINDASSSTSMVPSPAPASSTSPLITTQGSGPPPINVNSPNPSSAGSPSTHVSAAQATGVSPTATVPTTLFTSHSSSVVTVTASSTPSSTKSSAAWKKHALSPRTPLVVAFAVAFVAFS